MEYLLRACWRRKLRIFAYMAIGAVVLGLGGTHLKPMRYAATTEVVVYPDNLASAASEAYGLDPDRYVATQVATVGSTGAIAQVAKQLNLPPAEVAHMISVSQTSKTDVVAVKATSANAALSEKVSVALAQNYVDSVTRATDASIHASIANLGGQISDLEQKAATARAQLAAAGTDPAVTTSLQDSLNAYNTQLVSLTNTLATLEAGNAGIPTHIVSSSGSLISVVGDTTKKLAIYGLILGMVIGIAQVALTAGPGRSLQNLGAIREIEGIPVLGVMRPRMRLPFGLENRLPVRRYGASAVDLRVAQELTYTLKVKEQVAVVPIGSRKAERLTLNALQRLIDNELIMLRRSAAPGGGTKDDITVIPLQTAVAGDDPEGLVPTFLAIDLAQARPKDLSEAIAAMSSTGVEPLGIIGLQ